jgi:hypothetical protein
VADASKQVRPVQTVAQGDTGTTFATDTAIAREAGGTGASVSTMADLLTHLGRAGANGLASLDGSTLVPAAQIPAMVGTDGATPGTKGAVPAPAGNGTPTQSDTRRPLLGGGTWGGGVDNVSSAWISEVTDAAGNLVHRFGAPDRVPRRIVAKAFGTTYDVFGLNTPTLTTPGAAAFSIDDNSGTYITLTNDPLTERKSGVEIATVTKRPLQPELIVVFRAPLLRSRWWIGLFESDPSAGTDLYSQSGGIAGVGVYYDSAVGQPQTSNSLRDIAVDGTAKTYTRTSGSFLADGFRVGVTATWSNLANAGNNGARTITAVTATVMTVDDPGATMVNEASGASTTAQCAGSNSVFLRFVTCNGSTSAADQTETVTAVVPTANAWTAIRIRNLGAANWEFSVYNTAGYWDSAVTHTTTSPGTTAALGFYCTTYQIRGATPAGPSITFAAAADTITRATGSWYDDGFKIGDSVTISGTASNNVTSTITALTATVMTVGNVITDEGPTTSAALTTASSSMSMASMGLFQD